MITEPGIYVMGAEDYHSDPCAEPSLSSTGARTLASECPAVYWYERTHPQHKREFDIGTAGHLMVLEPHLFDDRVVVIDAKTKDGKPSKGYTSQEAKDQRDAAYANGKVPLLPEEAQMVREMREALWRDPVAKFAFEGGTAERSIFWRDAEFGIWRRTRPDYLPPHSRYLVDYKTSTTANPRAFARRLYDFGYHQQAAWYLDGVEAVTGTRPDRFAFVVQSKSAPYLVSVCWIEREAIEWGRIQNRYAIGLFADCLRRGQWPTYRPDVAAGARAFTVNLPPFALRDLQARHEAGEFEVSITQDEAA